MATTEKKLVLPPIPMSVGTTLVNKTGTWKYMKPIYQDKVAPCQEGCPAGEDISAQMHLISKEKYLEAWKLLRFENPLPSVCGRVCFHPCESVCNRGSFDQSVSINQIERVIGDIGLAEGKTEKPTVSNNQKVAIVGSGPAGLSAAYFLAIMGYKVTIFEAEKVAGGVLAFGIPEYRLPKNILSQEIKLIEQLGVEIKLNTRVGKDIPVEDLDKFDAVFLATGVHNSVKLNVEGEENEGVIAGLKFLKQLNLEKPPQIGPKVVVIGGGNTAMDSARSALRTGCEVKILYRRTRNEMPAIAQEIDEALREGIEIQFLVAPKRVIVRDGKVTGIECIKMELGEPDSSGRRKPIPIKGSDFSLEVNTIITAIGEQPDFSYLPKKIENDGWIIKTNQLGETSKENWFAGGDVIEQPHTVVHAIGSGKKAAIGIDQYLRGKRNTELPSTDNLIVAKKGGLSMARYLQKSFPRVNFSNEVVPYEKINTFHFVKSERPSLKHMDTKESINNFNEVNQALTKNEVLAESKRCFNCGLCNRCEVCLILCPDIAVYKDEKDNMQINLDYCKGCGICAHECPRNSMNMEREQ